jgi:L-threonylcarbamoyladenylate synthase
MESLPTHLLTTDPVHPDSAIIAEAAALIRAGQLVAFPTETVYGLGANALDAAAVDRIFLAKGRPSTDPVIVHIHAAQQLAELAAHVPDLAFRLIDAFWPGPLTLVLPRGPHVPSNVSAGLPTVAIRMPAHPVALALIEAAGVPIAAPSANLFAHPSPTTAQHVLHDLNGRIALILDSGPTRVGVESTILDISTDRPRLLRPGGIPLAALSLIVPDIEVVTRYARAEDGAVPAPGMLLKHYSPRADLRLFDGPDEPLRAALSKAAAELMRQGLRVGLLIADEDRAALPLPGVTLVSLGSLGDLSQVAQRLFAGLRDLDARGVDVILARAYPATGIGLAIRDRLIRAAEGRVTFV